jgi:hypothetical protein
MTESLAMLPYLVYVCLSMEYSWFYHPSNSVPLVTKLGGIIGIPFFKAPTNGSLPSRIFKFSSVDTSVCTRWYAAREGLSITLRKICLLDVDQDCKSLDGSEAAFVRTRTRTSESEAASAIPDASPRPAYGFVTTHR